jgi:hypothetical protein
MDEMTSHASGGKAGGPKTSEERALAIGETDARVFNCPSCSRPLAEGASKCPGCGARLIMGVLVKRAAGILALGFAFGMLIGGVATASVITLSLRGPVAAATPSASVEPSAAASASPSSGPVAAATAPPAAVSALSGTAVVNGRIAVDAETLTNTIAKKGVTTIEIARALRSLAADAALGIDLTDRMASWPDAAPAATKLDDFYRAIATTARDGLRASLSDGGAYRAAATSMLATLKGLRDVDAASRALAATVGLELPPVSAIESEAPSASAAP